MKSTYHIDSSQFSLQQLKTDLLDRELIPSRKPLKENLEKNLGALERIGITTLEELISALKSKTKIKEVAQQSRVGEDYLILLRREVNSYIPNPVPLHKLSGISTEAAKRLSGLGLKNSKQLFERSGEDNTLSALVSDSGIKIEALQKLSGMADLVRAYGVGPVFADLLYDGGIRSMDDFLSHTPQEIIDLYQEIVGKKADFSISDLKFSQTVAKRLVTDQSR